MKRRTSEPSMNEVKKRSYDDDGIEVPKKRVLRPRSGKSFYSNEVKMRPTDRYRRERPRYGVSTKEENAQTKHLAKQTCHEKKGTNGTTSSFVVSSNQGTY